MPSKKHKPKLEIAQAFIALTEETAIEKITVNMITEVLGKNRMTFYYHFTDKEQLLIWIFRYELGNALMEQFPESKLVWEKAPGGFAAEFPYYARNFDKENQLFNSPFFALLTTYFSQKKTYYQKVFAYRGTEYLKNYLCRLYEPAIREDIVLFVENALAKDSAMAQKKLSTDIHKMPSIEFLSELYTGAFLMLSTKYVSESRPVRTASDLYPFNNVVHDSLYLLINEHIKKL